MRTSSEKNERMVMNTYVVTGAGSGLGKALARVLSETYGKNVIGVDRVTEPGDLLLWDWYVVNLAEAVPVGAMTRLISTHKDLGGPICLVNCAGLNLLNWIEDITVKDYDAVMAVNARAPFLMVQGLLPVLKNGGTVCNIVSNAAHVPMTASLAYNASKGALHIMTLQMARELTKRWQMTVFGIAPHKLEGTGMSHYIEERVTTVRGLTPEAAKAYQLAAMPTGRETTPGELADFAGWLLAEKARHTQMSGTILPYGA